MSVIMNLYGHLPDAISGEISETLASSEYVRIERIVSHGQASPSGYWYDQEWDEWVVVLKGRARLRFEARPDEVEVGPGDWLNVPAHARHRVEWTDPDQDTVWLAVRYRTI